MMELEQIDRLARDAIEAAMKDVPVQRVISESTLNAYGEDGLRLRVVVPDEAADRLDVYRYRDAKAAVAQLLRAAGDERWPLLAFATESDMARDDEPEP